MARGKRRGRKRDRDPDTEILTADHIEETEVLTNRYFINRESFEKLNAQNRKRKKYGKKLSPMPISDRVMIKKIEWEGLFKWIMDHSQYSREDLKGMQLIPFFALMKQVEQEVSAKNRRPRS